MCLIYTSSRKRVMTGRTPIYGTAWMIPPSYQQSQQAYGMSQYPPPPPVYEQQQPLNGGNLNQGPYSQPPPGEYGYYGPGSPQNQAMGGSPTHNSGYGYSEGPNGFASGSGAPPVAGGISQAPPDYHPPENPPKAFVKQ